MATVWWQCSCDHVWLAPSLGADCECWLLKPTETIMNTLTIDLFMSTLNSCLQVPNQRSRFTFQIRRIFKASMFSLHLQIQTHPFCLVWSELPQISKLWLNQLCWVSDHSAVAHLHVPTSTTVPHSWRSCSSHRLPEFGAEMPNKKA